MLDEAMSAPSTADWQQAMTRLSAVLATMAGTDGTGRSALATLDRTQASGFRLLETISTLATLPWETPATLQTLLATSPAPATLTDEPQDAERIASVASMLDAERAEAAFATAAADPAAITSQRRLALLATLSNSWRSDLADWPTAVDEFLTSSADLLQSVNVVDRGEGFQILVLADNPNLPIAVRNDLPQPVTVTLTTEPLTAGLAIEEDHVSVTLEPQSQRIMSVPVQSVANGTVPVRVTLTSATGVPIGQPMIIRVDVQAGWETVGTIVVTGIIVAIFGFGIARNILRRRKQATAADVAAQPQGATGD